MSSPRAAACRLVVVFTRWGVIMEVINGEAEVRVRVEGIASRFKIVGDSVIARIDEESDLECWCPEHLEHLLDPPADPDNAVAVLRWCLAHSLEVRSIETIAGGAGVSADLIWAFLEAPADRAGDLLTLAEAGRLARFQERRFEDRELRDEVDDYRRIAQPYIEVAGLHYGEALRRAREVRDAYREANPDAYTLGLE